MGSLMKSADDNAEKYNMHFNGQKSVELRINFIN